MQITFENPVVEVVEVPAGMPGLDGAVVVLAVKDRAGLGDTFVLALGEQGAALVHRATSPIATPPASWVPGVPGGVVPS